MVGHEKLLDDFEKLQKSHNVVKSDLTKLTTSYDQFMASFLKYCAICPRIDLNDNDCDTNLYCDKTSLTEENTRLKTHLKKSVATCFEGRRNLMTLLSNQKDNIGKEGFGYPPKFKKANNNKKNSFPPLQNC